MYFALKRRGRVRAFSGIADFVVSGAGRIIRLPLSGLSGGASTQDDFIQGWIACSAFGAGPSDWHGLRGHVENDIQHLEMEMRTFVEDPAQAQTGHLAGLNAAGHLEGWSAKPESGTHELPVLVRLDDQQLFGFTDGRWANENFRAFDIPLEDVVRGTAVHRLHLAGGCSRPAPFGRADSFVMRTSAGLVHGAPVQVSADRVTGAFQIAANHEAVVSVSLRDGAYQSDTCRCDQSGQYDFNGKPCGFALPLGSSTPINPTSCKIVLRDAQGEDLGSFALSDFSV